MAAKKLKRSQKRNSVLALLVPFGSSVRQSMCLEEFSTQNVCEEHESSGKMRMIYSWGGIRAKRGLERFRVKNLPSTGSGFFRTTGAAQQRHQVLRAGHARPVPLQRFDHALGGAPAGPQHQEQ